MAEEYLAYTSDEREKVRIEEYARRYGGWQKGIEVLAGEDIYQIKIVELMDLW